MRIVAEPLAYGIPPDVGGNILDDLLRPQNVIVIANLPEPLAMSFLEFVPGALFEGVDKLNQVAGVRKTLTEEMNMVRHEAIGVKTEIPLSGSFQEMTEQPFACGLVLEKGRAPFGRDGYEINSATLIVFCRTSETFFEKRHVRLSPDDAADKERG
jgi:hypothetical protein